MPARYACRRRRPSVVCRRAVRAKADLRAGARPSVRLVRHLHGRRARRHHAARRQALRRGGLAALVAVLEPGLLAGLSDDDPAGITTYSVLGAELRYERVDVLVGAILTGVIGVFVVVCCAATLHAHGRSIADAADAARAP